MPSTDPFFEPYDRENIAYGDTPSAPLSEYLSQIINCGRAFDLGAGAGRDTLALAAAGYDVTAVDLSERGLSRIIERAQNSGLADRVTTSVADVRELTLPQNELSAVVATTVLDHIASPDAVKLWTKLCGSLTDQGMMYVEVHTTEDPGCPTLPGCDSTDPVSETSGAVINYFSPNQLAQWAMLPESRLRILRYEERLEWDQTHGPEHLHGKAVLLAVREGHYPAWYGQPVAFPRPK